MFSPARSAAPLTKPRQRANTLTSPFLPSPAPPHSASQSPSLSRSYRQPIGTGSIRRQQQQVGGHARSKSQGDAVAALSADVGSRGKRRAVFCDVVFDKLEFSEEGEVVYPVGPAGAFLNSLGERVNLPQASTSRAQPSRPTTPSKPRRVDYDRVRQSLLELGTTEESYCRKISSLQEHFAAPLRNFARSRTTAIIPAFEANHLFGNIDQLVPIAEAFEADLREIVARVQRDKSRLPSGFGEVILQHVERMEKPYTVWLSNVGAVDTLRRELDRSNSSFREYIERTQVVSRETAQTSGGFKEFLAEPHQRIARYRLMLDPILSSLPIDDPNVEPLQAAIDLLSAICAMEVDDATKRAAVFWALGEAIDGLPDALVGFDRHFIEAIDVDDIVEASDPRSTSETLRCTLWLFSDRLLITKRPRDDRTGKNLAGLDDVDGLVKLYQNAHLTSSQAKLLGSPKRIRRSIFGYRGLVDLAEVVAVDLGTSGSSDAAHEFGLLLDDPPNDHQSSHWNGRPTRRYVVAGTYAPEERAREKERFLARFGETVLQQKLRDGAAAAFRGRLRDEASEVYWSLWERAAYEKLRGTQKGKLALHVVDSSKVPLLTRPGLRPVVSVRATLLGSSGMCCFEVSSKSPASSSSETIAIDRIPPAIVELGMSYGLFSFPNLRPLSDLSRSRPRSGLLSVWDVFTSGGGLKRGSSMTSRGSSTATTTLDLPHLSETASPRASAPASPQVSLSKSYRGPMSKKSAPDLYGSLAKRSNDELDAAMRFEDSKAYDGLADLGAAPPVQPLSTRSRNRPRRSFSLPSPLDDLESAPAPAPTLGDWAPAADGRADEDPTVQDATMDAPFDTPWQPIRTLEAPDTSPMAYRPPARSASRHRMIGPRDMRSPAAMQGVEGSSPAQHLPFAREHSPAPLRQPHTSNTSTVTYQSSPAYSDVGNVSYGSQPSPAPKRPRPPIEASPRPTPAKKVASLAGSSAGPRAPAPLQPDLLGSARKASGGSLLQRRVPSGSSVLNRPRPMSRRIASGASTVRGPATPPRDVDEPDVFSPPAAVAMAEKREVQDVNMSDVDQQPFNRLRKHIDDMRLKLAREVAEDKENERFVSPTALTRSPQTRNVFGKAIGSDAPFSSPQSRFSSASKAFTPASESRARTRHLDKHVLAEWTRKLSDLVDDAEAAAASAATKPRSPTDGGGSALEIAMLEQERDLLAAELAALKEDAKKLADEALQKQAALEVDNAGLRQAYDDICTEANALQDEFNAALDHIELAVQATPGATGEYVELTRQLCVATSAQFRAEKELRDYRSSVQAQLEEKVRLEELCRRHGLLA
ncbi:hypothetical protein JCM10450v2_001046 [Rhodotorula kratochvilovae]